jgi:hypothetical protein
LLIVWPPLLRRSPQHGNQRHRYRYRYRYHDVYRHRHFCRPQASWSCACGLSLSHARQLQLATRAATDALSAFSTTSWSRTRWCSATVVTYSLTRQGRAACELAAWCPICVWPHLAEARRLVDKLLFQSLSTVCLTSLAAQKCIGARLTKDAAFYCALCKEALAHGPPAGDDCSVCRGRCKYAAYPPLKPPEDAAPDLCGIECAVCPINTPRISPMFPESYVWLPCCCTPPLTPAGRGVNASGRLVGGLVCTTCDVLACCTSHALLTHVRIPRPAVCMCAGLVASRAANGKLTGRWLHGACSMWVPKYSLNYLGRVVGSSPAALSKESCAVCHKGVRTSRKCMCLVPAMSATAASSASCV